MCETERLAQRELGRRVAEKLKRRLADLRATECPKDLVAGRPRELEGNHAGHIDVELCDGYHLVFSSNHNVTPISEDGRVDWSQVNRVKILLIEKQSD
jgi:plasmid maintenance system killer protein